MLYRSTIAMLLGFAGAAVAQDLQPLDYSPTDDITLRVVSIEDGSIGAEILVAVGNRTEDLRNIRVSCGLYGADGEPVGSAEGLAEAAPPKSEVVITIGTFIEGATKAFCRITGSRTV